MCTATWFTRDDSYELYFNRDELRTRKEALPPEIRERNNVGFITPIDGDAGGTWIGVNEYAVCIFLLNLYGPDSSGLNTGGHTSRGRLVLDLMDAANAETVEERMKVLDLDKFRPFTLGLISIRTVPRTFIWNGKCLKKHKNPAAPLSSSSFETKDVITNRIGIFHGLDTADSPSLADYHRGHNPEKGPYSVCMHRSDAKTVSLSVIKVARDEIRFDYTPGNPCERAEVHQRLLSLRR